MYIEIILFVLGFVFLVKGAGFLVDGSSSVAAKYGISNLVIGLTIVAFGTSAPELIVSSFAAFKGSAGVAMGNIIGSNISNTLLILGIAAVIRPLLVKKNTVNKEIPFSLLAILAVGLMVNDRIIDGAAISSLTRIDGFVLMLLFSIFIYYTFGISREDPNIIESLTEDKTKTYSNATAAIMVLTGLAGLYLGGRWIVSGAISFASAFGISETLIGLTIVAIGTSLPELAASSMAAYRGKTDIAIGNVVGSNIFNLLWVLGLSSIIRPIGFIETLNIDFLILISVTVLLILLIYVGKRNILGKMEGLILVILYALYIVFLVVRG